MASGPSIKYLYLQCDCKDCEYGPINGFSPEGFVSRYQEARKVFVARATDIPIPPEIEGDMDGNRLAWEGPLGQYGFFTMTRGKTNRLHKVLATLNGGYETEWVCKHAICTSRYIGRRLWNARHLFVHLKDDPYLANLIKWHKHLAGDSWEEPKKMWLTRHVCVTGWGYYDYGSHLFGQKMERR